MSTVIIAIAVWIILAAAGWAFIHGAAKLRRLEDAQRQSAQAPEAEIVEFPRVTSGAHDSHELDAPADRPEVPVLAA